MDEPDYEREAVAEENERVLEEWEAHDRWLRDYTAEPTEKGAAA